MIMPYFPANEECVRRTLADDLGNGRRIYNVCLGIARGFTNRRDNAEDLVMSAYLRAIENAGKYDRVHEIDTWLGRITRNICIDFLKKRCRSEVSLGENPESYADPSREEPFDILEGEETRAIIERAVMRLPENARAALVMKHFEGRSCADVARILRGKYTTIKERIWTAERHLRENIRLQDLVA